MYFGESQAYINITCVSKHNIPVQKQERKMGNGDPCVKKLVIIINNEIKCTKNFTGKIRSNYMSEYTAKPQKFKK